MLEQKESRDICRVVYKLILCCQGIVLCWK